MEKHLESSENVLVEYQEITVDVMRKSQKLTGKVSRKTKKTKVPKNVKGRYKKGLCDVQGK